MQDEPAFGRQTNENIISQLWAKYFPYWPVFLLLIASACGGAWLYLQYKLPVYESSATLLIKDERKGSEESKMMESLNMLSSKKIIENEIEVIQSRALMTQVVTDLYLYAPVFEKGKWKDMSAYTTSPVKIEVQIPDSLLEVSKVEFSFNPANATVNLRGHLYQLNQWVETPWGRLRFLSNNDKYKFTSPLYFSLINPKRVVQNLSAGLGVSSAGKLSSVINLKFKDEVPRRSEDILNTLISVYEKAGLNDKNALAYNTLSFLDERLKSVSSGLDSIEKALQQYRARKGAIDISSQGKLFLQNVSDNDQKLSEVNMKLAMLGQIEQLLYSNNSREGFVPTTLGFDEPVLSNLLNKLYDLQLQYEKLRNTTGENNPEVISIADQIKTIKPNILEVIRNQKRNLEVNKANLYSTNGNYTSLLQTLPQQERDLVEISREQNIKSAIYNFLLQKREETALSNSATVADSRVVDKAESSLDPVGTGRKMIYAMAVILAIGIGVVSVTARELFNRTILFRQEIEAITTFPIIGEIALEKSKVKLVVHEGVSSIIAEEFRLLRTSLHYLGIGTRGKKILVTSTIPGEGKSFVAVNLAMSLAIGGKKIILVEFDLNSPTLAQKLGIEGGKGISDYLEGKAEAEEVIIKTADNPNLFIMTAGNLAANPSELIMKERAEQLLNFLSEKFDYVIVDSAPIGVLSDGYILSRYCDATLFVIRHKHTPKKMLERLENNKINELKNIALVFNGVKTRGFSKNGYGYGYGYMNSKERTVRHTQQ